MYSNLSYVITIVRGNSQGSVIRYYNILIIHLLCH